MQTVTFTNENGTEIQVHFDDLKYQLVDGVDHSNMYQCRGYDANGTEYSGIATFTCGELDSIDEIEILEKP